MPAVSWNFEGIEMNEVELSLEERLQRIATGGAALLAIGTFFLHAAGYLSLRFRLRALGVAPELDAFSERFLFEGAHFLVYLLMTLPLLILVLLPLALLVALLRRSRRLSEHLDGVARAVAEAPPGRLAAFGVLWSVASMQLVLRHAFELEHLLLRPLPCHPEWLWHVLLAPQGYAEPLYFAFLILLLLPTFFCLLRERSRGLARWLLGALALVQWLLLPVHFGVLGAGTEMARVAELAGEPASSRVWRVFATPETVHFLVERPGSPSIHRLIEKPAKELGGVEVVRHERILPILAEREGRECRP